MYNPYVEYIGKMDIAVISPISDLIPFIESYVFYENTHMTNDVIFKALSSGKVEMFIHYNDSNLFLTNGKKEIKLNAFISGISEISNGSKIKPVSESRFFNGISITFSLVGVLQLLGLPVKSLTNKFVRIESIFGEKSKMLIDEISDTESNQEREEILNKFFLMLLNKKKKQDQYSHLLAVNALIIERNGCCTVNDLANHLNLTSRTIRRLFLNNIGIAPKNFLKIIRFNHACKLMSTTSEIDWFHIICSCGYYDQMHLIHEFKSIMNYTPDQFSKITERCFYFNRPFIVQ